MGSTSTPSLLPAGAAASPCSPWLAPDQHVALAASAPMEESDTRAPRPAVPADSFPPPGSDLRKPKYTMEGIFKRFTMRRVALNRALTTDEEAFFQKCEPGMPGLCLFGNTDGSWEVKPPETYVPHLYPEPVVGINKSRDNMKRHEWLQEVARDCDAWLISISFYYGSYLTLEQRKRLFTMINSLPTVQETFLASNTYLRIRQLEETRSSGPVQKNPEKDVLPCEDKKICAKRSRGPVQKNQEEVDALPGEDKKFRAKRTRRPVQKNQEEDDALPGEDKNFCASCGDPYHANGFWISCNVCERWYHGKCVKIKASEAKNIDHYECPECRSEKVGHDYDDDLELSDLFKRY